jgi:hypothetical protein
MDNEIIRKLEKWDKKKGEIWNWHEDRLLQELLFKTIELAKEATANNILEYGHLHGVIVEDIQAFHEWVWGKGGKLAPSHDSTRGFRARRKHKK